MMIHIDSTKSSHIGDGVKRKMLPSELNIEEFTTTQILDLVEWLKPAKDRIETEYEICRKVLSNRMTPGERLKGDGVEIKCGSWIGLEFDIHDILPKLPNDVRDEVVSVDQHKLLKRLGDLPEDVREHINVKSKHYVKIKRLKSKNDQIDEFFAGPWFADRDHNDL